VLPALTLSVVGADHPNKRGPGRRFEIELCHPGELVRLIPEPKNPADPRAIAVFSVRGVQLGYLTAERCVLVHKAMREGADVRAVFQGKTSFGAVIRVSFDGEAPALPAAIERSKVTEVDFWADEAWPDE
jgi:hypothetical protein